MDNLFLMGIIGAIGIAIGIWGRETIKKKWPDSEMLNYAINTYLFFPWIAGAFMHGAGGGETLFFGLMVPFGWGHGIFLIMGLKP